MLIVDGCASARTDADRLAAGFLHPQLGADQPRPALGPPAHPAGAARVASLSRPDDVALAIAHGPADDALHAFLDEAGRRGSLRVAFVGPGGRPPVADHVVVLDCDDPLIVQETQQTVFRMLPELVSIFFGQPGLLEDACITCGDVAVAGRVVALAGHGAVIESAGKREEVAVDLVEDVALGDLLLCHAGVALERLPGDAPEPADETARRSLGGGHGAADVDAAFAQVSTALVQSAAATTNLRAAIDLDAIHASAQALRTRLDAGARLLVLGEGRCSWAAADLAADALGLGWPAVALTGWPADEIPVAGGLLTLGRHGDIALAITAGVVPANLQAALEEAHRRGMMTCAIAGGGAAGLACVDWMDELFVVDGHDASCVQEGHAAIYHLLLDVIGGRT